ncbi:hypothetical protein ACHAWO_006996 [Cyclotella atomus]|uniref:Uncharacterized protein n=1 Tax=Cyclotella atomus TaxID=382360 RepID=A0ABD3NQU4_9STRA
MNSPEMSSKLLRGCGNVYLLCMFSRKIAGRVQGIRHFPSRVFAKMVHTQGLECTIHARKSNELELPPSTSNEETTKQLYLRKTRLIQLGKSEEIKRFDAVREKHIYSLDSMIRYACERTSAAGVVAWVEQQHHHNHNTKYKT